MKIVERYAVSDVTHVLHHTCASWVTQHRVPWSVIAGYLGHKDERTTSRIMGIITLTIWLRRYPFWTGKGAAKWSLLPRILPHADLPKS